MSGLLAGLGTSSTKGKRYTGLNGWATIIWAGLRAFSCNCEGLKPEVDEPIMAFFAHAACTWANTLCLMSKRSGTLS